MQCRRAIVVAAGALVAVSIWTVAPLLALWVGSHATGETVLSMRAVAVVVGVLAASVYALTALLMRLNDLYLRLARQSAARRQSLWLSPLSEQPRDVRARIALTPVEWALVASVQLAAIAFLVWFLFIAGSPLPG